jgi:DNA (cytosine-5)-methyltransferase 1
MNSPTQQRPYTLAELFCGCGGFSHGFARTGLFRVLLGVDIKPLALSTFRSNHADASTEPTTYCQDLRTLPIEQLKDALACHGVSGPGELDCLIGGPPCQGFSQLRRGEERQRGRIIRFTGYNRFLEDPRNALVLRFLEVAAAVRPKFIVIENVPQILRHSHYGRTGHLSDSFIATLQDLGYSVAVGTVNAADYGVPQLRERAIFVASSVSRARLPDATHSDPNASLTGRLLKPWVTVADAISDLPEPHDGRDDLLGGGSIELYVGDAQSEFARLMRSSSYFPHNHITRKYSPRILSIIRKMRQGETWDYASERIQNNYRRLIQRRRASGETEARTRARLIRSGEINSAFYRRYYWSAYTRLHWQRPALTITANANFLGSGRFTHPERDRGITMREAARLQSFDDDFRFLTDKTGGTTQIGIGLDMIGEAVPPLLAQVIANEVAQGLAVSQRSQSDVADVAALR